MIIIIIRTGTCSYGANDYIEVLITIFTYFFVKMNCRSILADGKTAKTRCFSGQLAVLKMSLILFLARGSSATNWKTSNTQFTTRSSPFFRALHPVFWKCSTANSGAKHRSHIFVFVKSSWSANNRNELQVTKLAWW